MKSTKEILQKVGNNSSVSLKDVIQNDDYYSKSKSLLEVVARHDIRQEHGKVDASETKLGPIKSDLIRSNNNEFIQDFSGGKIKFLSGNLESQIVYQTTIRFVGFKAFGITSGPGSDEPYFIISVYSPDNKKNITTEKIPEGDPFEEVDKGTERAYVKAIWQGPPTRLQIFTVAVENDLGDPDDVKKTVKAELDKHIDVASAAGTVVAAGFGLPIPEGLLRDVLGGITLGLSTFIGNLVGDIPIGTDSLPLKGIDMEKAHETPFPTNTIAGNTYTHETQLMSLSGASYKAYFEVVTKKIIESPGQ